MVICLLKMLLTFMFQTTHGRPQIKKFRQRQISEGCSDAAFEGVSFTCLAKFD